MGVDAWVRCNCWENGLTSEPPVPREQLYIDEFGSLAATNEEDEEEIEAWLETACDHPEMVLAGERIAYHNWFERFGRMLSGQPFPTLVTELGMSYATPAEAAERALAELASLRKLNELVPRVYVLRPAVIEEDVEFCGPFVGLNGPDMATDDRGFRVQDTQTGEELFRSMRFHQTPLGSDREPVQLLDLATGHRFLSPLPVLINVSWDLRRAEAIAGDIESVRLTVGHYESVLAALESVFRASVESRNPVHWSY